MCLALYLFTDNIVEERKFDNENPGMYIRSITEREVKVLTWISDKKNVYYVGSSQGCGCGWRLEKEWDEDTEKLEKKKDREDLFNLLTVLNLKDSHLIICWEGDQGEELEREEILNIDNVKDVYFEFEECVNYILQ